MKKLSFLKAKINAYELMRMVKPTKCILDIGCANARERIAFRTHFSGPIHYFEADPRWDRSLKRIEAKDNNFVIRKAVSDIDGEVKLLQSKKHINYNPKNLSRKMEYHDNWKFSNTIKTASKEHRNKWLLIFKDDPIVVPSITLNSWIKDKDIEEIDLIWLTVEGAEGDVIKEGLDVFNRARYIYMPYRQAQHMPDAIDYKYIRENFLTNFKDIYMNEN